MALQPCSKDTLCRERDSPGCGPRSKDGSLFYPLPRAEPRACFSQRCLNHGAPEPGSLGPGALYILWQSFTWRGKPQPNPGGHGMGQGGALGDVDLDPLGLRECSALDGPV